MLVTQPPPRATRSDHEAIVGRIPAWRKLLYSLLIPATLFVSAEAVVRIGAYFIYERSPYFLFYGLTSAVVAADPNGHSVGLDGYFKFPPGRVLHQYGLFKQPTPIRINSLGFRGPDFTPARRSDVYRIICLGESSTFGFFARDDHTYPYLLERRFAEATDGMPYKKVEVVNAGIPHADSDNILAMLKGEIFDYSPNLITIYAGYNDAAALMDPSPLYSALRWAHMHLATYVAVKAVVSKLTGLQLHSRWRTQMAGPSVEYVERQIALHVKRFERNLREITALARARGVHVVLIRQPVNKGWGNAESSQLTYAQKIQAARERLRTGRPIEENETVLLIHAALTAVLDTLAKEENVPVLDNIAIVDAHPEYFASYVHLTEDGNAALATALHRTITSLSEGPRRAAYSP